MQKETMALFLGNKQESFSLLIPGTKHHYYLNIIDAFKRERHTLSKETRELMKQLKANFYDDDAARLTLQELFLRYDGAKSDDERNQIIQEIDINYVFGYYDHVKLADVKNKKDTDDKVDDQSMHTLDLNKYFNNDEHLEKIYQNDGLIYSLHKIFYNKLDFNRISESEFLGFLSNWDTFATMANDSFWDKLMTTFDQKYKSNKHYSPDSYLFDILLWSNLRCSED